VSLRILFADDSMTAQNMGKKILSEAGYDVVAVSNGAAAVKKIAEQKPDIIILDVYMPGYTGLEVCEKVRGSLDTLKTPVLLTVGKMEPYKPEDANRVKADGVIIKPFEASDLLAIVKKFEERIGNEPPPVQPAVVASAYTEEAPAEPPMETQTPSNRASMQPMVEVPDHMASSAAFGDMLGSEPANVPSPSHFAVNTPSAAFETSVIVPAPPIAVADETAVVDKIEEVTGPVVAPPAPPSADAVLPEMDASPEVTVTPVEVAPEPHLEQNWRDLGTPEAEAEPAEEAPTAAEIVSSPQAEAAPAQPEAAAEVRHPQFIPVFKDPEVHAGYDLMPTAVPPVDDVEIPREPALQETAEEATRNTVADQVEPGLMTAIEQPAEAAHAVASPAEEAQDAAPVAAAEVSDADFEARVAAAMAAYNHGTEAEPAHAQAVEEPEPAAETHEVAAEHAAAAEIPSFEYQPAAGHAQSAAEIVPDKVAVEANADHAVVETGAESAIPEAAAAAAADSGADHHTIAQAIHRVMERLKPELVEEIMKELRAKK
jgi:CheY-like chemotaxis protein